VDIDECRLTWPKAISTSNIGGTLKLIDDLITTVGIISVNGGTLDANDQNVTTPYVNYLTTGFGVLYLGNGTWTINGASATSWRLGVTTVNAEGSTIKFTNTTNTAVTFTGGTQTYNNIWFSRGASTASNTITGSNTFNDIKDDGTAAHSLLFTKSTTQIITTFDVSGAGGGGSVRIILDTADGAGTFTLHGTGTTISCDWLDIRRSTVDASPDWYAGSNSLNTASNTNWIFEDAPATVIGPFPTHFRI
jgi:hypothetical protein